MLEFCPANLHFHIAGRGYKITFWYWWSYYNFFKGKVLKLWYIMLSLDAGEYSIKLYI